MKLKKIVITLLILGCIFSIPGYRQVIKIAANLSSPMTLVIDAGHGGMDGGAVSADGTSEEKINLEIAKALRREAARYGITVVMTRETEEGLYEEGASTDKWTKVGDLKERKRIIEEAGADLTVSIHLNNFLSDTSVHGAQVFYPKGALPEILDENKLLAEEIQESLKTSLANDADRIVLPKDDIYLFRNADHPMILIECGFLSNPQDLSNLKRAEYQQSLAGAVMKAIATHYKIPLSEKKTRVIDSRTT